MTRAEVIARMCRAAADKQPLAAAMEAGLRELARCVRDEGASPPLVERRDIRHVPGSDIRSVPVEPLPWWPDVDAEGRGR